VLAGRAPVKADRARLLFIGIVGASLLSVIVILDKTSYPFDVDRVLVFDYLLREQDIPGTILVIAIAIAAWLPPTRASASALVGFVGRHVWVIAVLVFVLLCAAMLTVTLNHALAGDEHLALFQSRAFAAGHLTGQFPPEMAMRLVPTAYQWRWLIVSPSGAVAAVYWPGFALLLAPFSLAGAPWACNPLLTALSIVLIARLAERFTGSAVAGGWAVLFAIGSPGFTAMALSYFSMPAHLFLNLLFVWLMVQGGTRRLLAAGFVGSLALVQSNPVPHLLFALPWLMAVARESGSRRKLAALAVGYAPVSLILGLGWWLFLRGLQGKIEILPYGTESGLIEQLANGLAYLGLQLYAVFTVPDEYTLMSRAAEQVRLWSWSVPGLPLLTLAGWWLLRREAEVRLLGWSLACTLVGYLFVNFDQGYGWGARYVHSAWGVLPVLAAGAMVSVPDPTKALRLSSYVLRLTLLSLVFNTALRFLQIGLFMEDHVALRPPFEKGQRQIVFIRNNVYFYTQDFVQNDPFLREPVIFMMSRGPRRDYQEVIQPRYPQARLVYDGLSGQVWRLD
jgi:hypothetical protein